METVTIVPIDGTVVVDGIGLTGLTFPVSLDMSNIHAIQWEKGKGRIEQISGEGMISFESLIPYQPIIDVYNKKLAESRAEEKKRSADMAVNIAKQKELEATPGWKRQKNYPSTKTMVNALIKQAGIDMDSGKTLDSALAQVVNDCRGVDREYPLG